MEGVKTMRIMYRCCAGLDVHKETVQCCVRRVEPDGSLQETVRQFGTMTDDLLEMVEALKAQGVTHVAMESTGVFWKPIYNLLEEHFSIVLVNPAHCKQVPGRKTDVKDCQWLAELLQYGLLRGSFIPPRWQRDLRDLTRERTQLINERTRVANRMHKILEDANIKLGSVATDILGASGRDMLRALIGGEQDPEVLAEMARSRLRDKIPQLRRALRGRVREHHRFQLALQWDHLEQLDQLVARLNEKITQLYQPYEQQLALVDEVPGMDRRMAETVMAEVGMDMRQFPSDSHLCSWAAVCSGNHESAGKRRSGRTRCRPQQEQLSGRALPEAGRPPRQEAGDHCRGPHDSANHLSHASRGDSLPRSWPGLLRPAESGTDPALPGQPSGASSLQSHARATAGYCVKRGGVDADV